MLSRSLARNIDIVRRIQMDTAIPRLAHLKNIVVRKLSLDIQTVVNIRTPIDRTLLGTSVGFAVAEPSFDPCKVVRQDSGIVDILGLGHRFRKSEWKCIEIHPATGPLRLVKCAKAAPDYRLIVDRIRQTYSGCELGLIGICSIRWETSLAGRLNVLTKN